VGGTPVLMAGDVRLAADARRQWWTGHAPAGVAAAPGVGAAAGVAHGQYPVLEDQYRLRPGSVVWFTAWQGRIVEAETRYHPSSDQLALASTIDESLATLLPLARLHRSPVEDAATWSGLDDIGIFGIGTSEEEGGSGLGAAEEALIVMALGRRLAAPAVLATIGAAHGMPAGAGSPGPRGTASANLVRRRRVAAAYRRGQRVIVVEDTDADLALLRDADGATLHELDSCNLSPIDDRLWLAGLHEAVRLGEPLARFDSRQLLRLRLIDAAALAGIAQAALEMAVAYAGVRSQFGRPIGSFQAVKHHCANMAIAARCARDQASFAAVAIDEGRADAPLQVECALFVAGTAALEVAGKNIQIHGGMGFSDEADPHLLLKRAQLLLAVAGGLEAANERIANIQAGW
jgi:alkylation response protein AidB-like acyl-CoA dehydrogenase